MSRLTELQALLEQQFGPFIRDSKYRLAFDHAMQSIRSFEPELNQIDIFYLFMHHLILELFNEIDVLNRKLENCT